MLTLVEAAAYLGIGRTSLRTMLEESPADLPGRPIPIGKPGGQRRHFRWSVQELERWFAAYGAWTRGEAHRPARRPRIGNQRAVRT